MGSAAMNIAATEWMKFPTHLIGIHAGLIGDVVKN